MIRKQKKENVIVLVLRVLLGVTFLFSAFVKGVDPMGTAYRVEDYLEAYGWYFMLDYALYLGIFLILVEFLLGVSMLLRLRFKLGSLGVLLLMIIFTVITYFDAKLNLVPDCGCFGDAVKLTNWETFYKNVVLIIMALLLFAFRSKSKQSLTVLGQSVALGIITLLFGGFVYYNIIHLPIMDFRAWKIGNDMKTIGVEKAKVYVSYKNNKNGEIKEYLSPNYPWNDSIWLAEWDFIGQRFDNSGIETVHDLIIEDSLGNDYTKDIIENPDTQLLLVMPDLDLASEEGINSAKILIDNLNDEYVAVLTGTDFETAGKFMLDHNLDLELYFSDDIELKAMIRSNPGIVVLKNGIVINKYHFNDFPANLK